MGRLFRVHRQQHLHRKGLLRPRLVELAAHGGNQLVAGLQADAVALDTVGILADAVTDGDGQLLPVAAAGDGDGAAGIGVLADIGEEIVEDPAEMSQIHLQAAGDRVCAGFHMEASRRALFLQISR